MSKKYLIRNETGRPVAGIFSPIVTLEMAERVRLQWQHNWPGARFDIEELNLDARGAVIPCAMVAGDTLNQQET